MHPSSSTNAHLTALIEAKKDLNRVVNEWFKYKDKKVKPWSVQTTTEQVLGEYSLVIGDVSVLFRRVQSAVDTLEKYIESERGTISNASDIPVPFAFSRLEMQECDLTCCEQNKKKLENTKLQMREIMGIVHDSANSQRATRERMFKSLCKRFDLPPPPNMIDDVEPKSSPYSRTFRYVLKRVLPVDFACVELSHLDWIPGLSILEPGKHGLLFSCRISLKHLVSTLAFRLFVTDEHNQTRYYGFYRAEYWPHKYGTLSGPEYVRLPEPVCSAFVPSAAPQLSKDLRPTSYWQVKDLIAERKSGAKPWENAFVTYDNELTGSRHPIFPIILQFLNTKWQPPGRPCVLPRALPYPVKAQEEPSLLYASWLPQTQPPTDLEQGPAPECTTEEEETTASSSPNSLWTPPLPGARAIPIIRPPPNTKAPGTSSGYAPRARAR
ncbi:hypothetical protein EVG20_g477 [Dentipellis fragilis]|uniref:DUF6697 domain-containing protein n=1 Tax=Dentipellis fragilis TaxID=205917 RepID=A0A4Y9ZCN5_9AGAM|nr:hypothetical protein EVG20_g477 [Dentipellis fragilis]